MPKDVELVYNDYSSIIAKDNKVIASVWKFNLKDLIVNCPLNCFVESGHDHAIVWNIKFYNNGILLSDVHPNANITCAMGYMAQDENRTLFMHGTKAMMFARTLGDSIKLFFADVDPMVDIVANADAVNAFNWNALRDDLYENCDGTCTCPGSLCS